MLGARLVVFGGPIVLGNVRELDPSFVEPTAARLVRPGILRAVDVLGQADPAAAGI